MDRGEPMSQLGKDKKCHENQKHTIKKERNIKLRNKDK